MKTIKEWYNLVKDDKLRNELLEAYDETYAYDRFIENVKSLADAINYGFDWRQNGRHSYWVDVCAKARNNEIEIITDTKEYNYTKPTHYNNQRLEVFEMMKRVYGKEALILFCEMNAFKYRMRLGSKPNEPIERDLKKCQEYEKKAKELLKE